MGSIVWCLKSDKLKARRDVRHFRPARFNFAHALQGGQSAVRALIESEAVPEPASEDADASQRQARSSDPQGGLEQAGQGITPPMPPPMPRTANNTLSRTNPAAGGPPRVGEKHRAGRASIGHHAHPRRELEQAGQGNGASDSKEAEPESTDTTEYPVRRISRHRGEGDAREYQVHWDGVQPSGKPWRATWEHHDSV